MFQPRPQPTRFRLIAAVFLWAAPLTLGVPPDLDGDGQVDAFDVDLFYLCLSGPGVTGDPMCNLYGPPPDFDGDLDVDQVDFYLLQISLGAVPFPPTCTPAGSGSKITYTLEMGGDNHASDWSAGIRTLYTRGSGADGQSFSIYQGALVNYAVVLRAEGIQNQPCHPAHGYQILGAANFVFDLRLHQGTEVGPPATGAIFNSTINTGIAPNPLAAGAFAVCYAFPGYPNGRVIDTVQNGGAGMEPIFCYPDFVPASAKLIGAGAGYSEWNRPGGINVRTLTGVGVDRMHNGLGVVPLFEGQIDMSALPLGTYVLKVIPEPDANTVVRGDLNMVPPSDRNAFAVPVNETVGDTITFITTDTPPPDCNQNGVDDALDVSNGTSPDCDANGVPDECDPDADGDHVPDACDLCLNTVPGATVDLTGCSNGPGDLDHDGDVDQQDFGHLQLCLSGTDIVQGASDCQEAKLDPDTDVDDTDMAIFLDCLSGPNIPANPNCAN